MAAMTSDSIPTAPQPKAAEPRQPTKPMKFMGRNHEGVNKPTLNQILKDSGRDVAIYQNNGSQGLTIRLDSFDKNEMVVLSVGQQAILTVADVYPAHNMKGLERVGEVEKPSAKATQSPPYWQVTGFRQSVKEGF